jgi:AcrR family transcriptional regulator
VKKSRLAASPLWKRHAGKACRLKKQEVVRQEIWNAAIDLFHSAGFDAITVEQIASRAGVSRRTFFRYFSSKEDVLASAVKNYVEAITGDTSDSSAFDVAKRAIPKETLHKFCVHSLII